MNERKLVNEASRSWERETMRPTFLAACPRLRELRSEEFFPGSTIRPEWHHSYEPVTFAAAEILGSDRAGIVRLVFERLTCAAEIIAADVEEMLRATAKPTDIVVHLAGLPHLATEDDVVAWRSMAADAVEVRLRAHWALKAANAPR